MSEPCEFRKGGGGAPGPEKGRDVDLEKKLASSHRGKSPLSAEERDRKTLVTEH